MEKLAPEAVGVAAGFGAAGEIVLRRHADVIETAAGGRVLIAVPEVEDLEGRIGQRLTAGAPGAGNKGTIGKLLAHRRGSRGTRRRGSSAVTLAPLPRIERRKSNHRRRGRICVMLGRLVRPRFIWEPPS